MLIFAAGGLGEAPLVERLSSDVIYETRSNDSRLERPLPRHQYFKAATLAPASSTPPPFVAAPVLTELAVQMVSAVPTSRLPRFDRVLAHSGVPPMASASSDDDDRASHRARPSHLPNALSHSASHNPPPHLLRPLPELRSTLPYQHSHSHPRSQSHPYAHQGGQHYNRAHPASPPRHFSQSSSGSHPQQPRKQSLSYILNDTAPDPRQSSSSAPYHADTRVLRPPHVSTSPSSHVLPQANSASLSVASGVASASATASASMSMSPSMSASASASAAGSSASVPPFNPRSSSSPHSSACATSSSSSARRSGGSGGSFEAERRGVHNPTSMVEHASRHAQYHASAPSLPAGHAPPGAPNSSPSAVRKPRKRRASVPCDTCGRIFGEAAALRKHQKVVHEQRKDFKCEECGREFAEKSNLKKHAQARHGTAANPHPCSYCGKEFNFSDGLRRHINNCHLGLRPYVCDVDGCGAAFKQRTHLQKHKLRVNHGRSGPAQL